VTGAGASTVAWTPETSYLDGVSGTPTYRVPGTNVRTQTAELDRNLAAVLLPGDIETNDWVGQNIGGQLNLQWVLTDDEYHRFVFNDEFVTATPDDGQLTDLETEAQLWGQAGVQKLAQDVVDKEILEPYREGA